jgi:hypothetical protein
MPVKDINISMGYPFSRSAVGRLVEILLQLQESRPAEEEIGAPLYAWRPLVECLRHPCITMLGAGSLSKLLQNLESEVLAGKRLVNPRALAALVAAQAAEGGNILPEDILPEDILPEDILPADIDLLLKVIDTCLAPWEQAHTAEGLAAAISALCSLLLEHGGRMWERFALEAECLFRLMQHIVPALRGWEDAALETDSTTLFVILRELLAAERVPFEAEPLTGVQVLGMLETRLLCFDRVIVLDATEDKIPGAGGQDPLLPDSLRGLAGLPDATARDRVAAYNFFRLLAGASEAVLLYQTGETQTGLFDRKKSASRFVEELIWRAERAAGRLLGPNDAPRHSVRQKIRPFSSVPAQIPKSPAVGNRLADFLKRPVSPSALDEYMKCPVRFFYSALARLRPLEQVAEGPDPSGIGNLLHETLRCFYEPRLGRPFTPDAEDIEELQSLFLSRLAASGLPERLPVDSLLMLEVAGPERLARYLLNQPEGSIPLRVEAELTTEIAVGGKLRILAGRVDRLDQRQTDAGPGAMLIDYKSGSLRLPNNKVWTDDEFWQVLTAWQPGDEDILASVAERMESLQLPAYLQIYGAVQDPPAWDAALVELRDKGEENCLFGSKFDQEARSLALTERIPALLRFVLLHMEQAPAFLPHPGRQCQWCFCSQACGN